MLVEEEGEVLLKNAVKTSVCTFSGSSANGDNTSDDTPPASSRSEKSDLMEQARQAYYSYVNVDTNITHGNVVLRSVAMVYFVSITMLCALVSSCALLGCLGVYKVTDLVRRLAKDEERERDCKREWNLGLLLDMAALAVVKFNRWIFRVNVDEASVPRSRLSEEEMTRWISLNQIVGTDGIASCKIPINPKTKQRQIPGRCIIMCNHMSNLDGFVIKAALYPIVSKAACKSEVKYVPFVGTAIAWSGQPLVYFTRAKAITGGWGTSRKQELVERCREITDRNVPLLVFPEGARRRYGRMAPFRHGMFNLAIEEEIPILPCVIHGSQWAWSIGSPLIDSADIQLRFSDELVLPKKTDSPENVVSAVRSRMLEMLAGFPAYDPVAEAPFATYEEYKAFERFAVEEKAKQESKKTR